MQPQYLIQFALVLGCVLFAAAHNQKARYDFYHVYRLQVETNEQLTVLKQIQETSDGYIFLEPPVLSKDVEIIVPPHKLADINDIFEALKIKNQLKSRNFQKQIETESPTRASPTFGWNAYYDLEAIYKWLDELLVEHPTVLTNLTVGESFEGRTIRAVKLSHKAGNPTIFIESTIHAREWITVATATYVLNELLTSNDTDIVNLAQNFDWVIVPVLNVDGYAYTHTKNRLWRKTRQPHSSSFCFGTDANRNFDVHFAEAGTSPNPCAETYPGPRPFSEPETKALAKFIDGFDNVKLYLSFHSFGQYILFPYGHTRRPSPNHGDLTKVGQAAGQAISKRYGTRYKVGSIAATLYLAAGATIDWVYAANNITLPYTFEFRGTGNSLSGFILPADQIIPNSLEFIDGLKAMIREARTLNYF